MGGLRFKAQERLLPFVEARYEIMDGHQFILAAGVGMSLPRPTGRSTPRSFLPPPDWP